MKSGLPTFVTLAAALGSGACGASVTTARQPRLVVTWARGGVDARIEGAPEGRRMAILVASPPYVVWAPAAAGGDAESANVVASSDSAVALQGVSVDGGPEVRTRLEFVGTMGWWQRRVDEPTEAAFDLPALHASVSPADGSVAVDCDLLGTGISLTFGTPAQLLGGTHRGGWIRSMTDCLVDSDPPCVWVSERGVLAFDRDPQDADRATAVVRPAGFGHAPVVAEAAEKPTDGAVWETLVRLPGRTLRFIGPRWGAGGLLHPVSIRFTQALGPVGMPLECKVTEDQNAVRWEYHRDGTPPCTAVEYKTGPVLLEVGVEGGAFWRLSELADAGSPRRLMLEGAKFRDGGSEFSNSFEILSGGALTAFALSGRPRVTLDYDERGRAETVAVTGGPRWSVTYDEEASMVRVRQDGVAGEHVYAFDAARRCIGIVHPGGLGIERQFDALGRVALERDSDAVTNYEYDAVPNVRITTSHVGGAARQTAGVPRSVAAERRGR